MLNVHLSIQLATKYKRHVWLAAKDDYDEFQSKLFHLHETLIQCFLRSHYILYIHMHCTVYIVQYTQFKRRPLNSAGHYIQPNLFCCKYKSYNATPNSCFRLRILLAANNDDMRLLCCFRLCGFLDVLYFVRLF